MLSALRSLLSVKELAETYRYLKGSLPECAFN